MFFVFSAELDKKESDQIHLTIVLIEDTSQTIFNFRQT